MTAYLTVEDINRATTYPGMTPVPPSIVLRKMDTEYGICDQEPRVTLEWDEITTIGTRRMAAFVGYNAMYGTTSSSCASSSTLPIEGSVAVRISNAWGNATTFIKEKIGEAYAIQTGFSKTASVKFGEAVVKVIEDHYCANCGTGDDNWGWSTNASFKCATTRNDWCGYYTWKGGVAYRKPEPIDPKVRLQQIIDSRQSPRIIIASHRTPPQMSKDIRELRARGTLRRVVGNDRYRNFMRTGFVSIRGKDGKYYQLYPGHGITHVYEGGNLVARLCLYFPGDYTPTDSLIMRYLLILNNPALFWEKANKHALTERPGQTVAQPDTRGLSEIFKELKEGKLLAS